LLRQDADIVILPWKETSKAVHISTIKISKVYIALLILTLQRPDTQNSPSFRVHNASGWSLLLVLAGIIQG